MGRLPTAVEVAAYNEEVSRAAVEDREPKWSSPADVVKENIAEENLVFGSQSMINQGYKGRHESKGTVPQDDEDLGVHTTGEYPVYKETQPEDDDPGSDFGKRAAANAADARERDKVYDPNYQLGTAIAEGLQGGPSDPQPEPPSEPPTDETHEVKHEVVHKDDSDKDSDPLTSLDSNRE